MAQGLNCYILIPNDSSANSGLRLRKEVMEGKGQQQGGSPQVVVVKF
jgi:hypothetical protein